MKTAVRAQRAQCAHQKEMQLAIDRIHAEASPRSRATQVSAVKIWLGNGANRRQGIVVTALFDRTKCAHTHARQNY
jgi:hypothetical protein